MRDLRYIATLLFTALCFVGCERSTTSTVNYNIDVENEVWCNFDSQWVDIEYQLEGIADDAYPKVKATASDSWVVDIDCTEQGIVAVEVEANDGPIRSTRVTISAGGSSTEVTLTQLGAPTKRSHTLMFYFFGTSLGRYFDRNIEDAKTAIGSGILGDSGRVIIFRQSDKHTASIVELCYNPSNKSVFERTVASDINIAGEIISPETIGRHVAMMAEAAPAERYGIVLAGHGHGWLTREAMNSTTELSLLYAGYDPWTQALGAETTRAFGEYNVQVDIPELAEGLSNAGVELEYILFDACFMSNVEAIYDLRTAANYIIASPCEIMGNGFPYHRTLPYLFATGGETSDLVGAAESYYKFYRDEYTSSSRCGSVTVYNCAEMEALAESTRVLAATAKSDYDTSTLQTYEGQKVHIFYDFGEWAATVATDDAAFATFRTQLDRTVVATFTLPEFYSAYGTYGTYPINVDVYTGVTTSAPSEAYPEAWQTTNWYKRVWE